MTTRERSPLYPDVPTFAESGLPGVDSWYGVFVPAGTQAPVVTRLNQGIRDAADKVEQEGLVSDVGTPEALGAYVGAEERRWRQIIERAGLKAKP